MGAALDNPSLFVSDGTDDTPDSGGLVEKLQKLLTDPDLTAIFLAATDLAQKTGKIDASALLQQATSMGVGSRGLGWLEQRLAIQQYDADVAQATVEKTVPLLWKAQQERRSIIVQDKSRRARLSGDDESADSFAREALELQRSKPPEWVQAIGNGQQALNEQAPDLTAKAEG